MAEFEIMPQEAAQLHGLAERVGTPFYVYDAALVRARYRALTRSLPDAGFFYSLKANPNLSLVGLLVAQGAGAEVSSRLELETAVAAGAPAERILMVGPGKAEADLERAVSLGIKAIVVESLAELDQIDRIAAKAGRCQPIALRINPNFKVSGARLNMSGRPTQFGIDETAMESALARVAALDHLRLAGLHVYMGTRILAHETIVENTRGILELAARVAQTLPEPMAFIDIGGGYGVPYYEDETPLDLAALGEAMRPLLRGSARPTRKPPSPLNWAATWWPRPGGLSPRCGRSKPARARISRSVMAAQTCIARRRDRGSCAAISRCRWCHIPRANPLRLRRHRGASPARCVRPWM